MDYRLGRKSRTLRRRLMIIRPLDSATQIRSSKKSSYVNKESRKSPRLMNATSKKKLSGKWRGLS